ncbi:MAG: hypothetical protein WEA04_02875 [Candidatus Andersenbacteria bacterium]
MNNVEMSSRHEHPQRLLRLLTGAELTHEDLDHWCHRPTSRTLSLAAVIAENEPYCRSAHQYALQKDPDITYGVYCLALQNNSWWVRYSSGERKPHQWVSAQSCFSERLKDAYHLERRPDLSWRFLKEGRTVPVAVS